MTDQERQEILLRSLGVKLEDLLRRLSTIDEQQLNRSPAEGKWSIGQIMSHVMLAEKYGLAYVKKKLSFDPELADAKFRARIRFWLLRTILRLPIKLKAPKGVGTESLPKHVAYADIMERWRKQRADLEAYLSILDPKWKEKEVYKHPLVGRMSMRQMLGFFVDHFDHHEKQIERLLKV